jgi:hypothetical protein
MAFTNGNFKEAGGPGNEVSGGQVYSYHSSADTLATIMASGYFDSIQEGYFDSIQDVLNDRDIMIISGSDGTAVVRLTNTAGVITVENASSGGIAQSLSGAGAADLLTALTLHTSSGADVVTLADGLYIGQKKTITCVVDGGSTVVTPTTTLGTWSTVTLLVVGDTVDLMWSGALGWIILGVGPGVNTAGNPLVA